MGLFYAVAVLGTIATVTIAAYVLGGVAIYNYFFPEPELPETPEVEVINFIYKGEPFKIPDDYPFDKKFYDEHDFKEDQVKLHFSGQPSIYDDEEYYPSSLPKKPVKSPVDDIVKAIEETPEPEKDKDTDKKGGGKDPIVLAEGFGYIVFDAYKCRNAPNSFDYDIDGFPEHMCYWYLPTTKIFFNDRYGNQTLIDGSQFIGDFTHLWQDFNSNIFIDDGELTEIEEHGIQITARSDDGWIDYDSGRYVYCSGGSDFGNVLCTYPTYWQTQEWMK